MNSVEPSSGVQNGWTVVISGGYFTRPNYSVSDDSVYANCTIISDSRVECGVGSIPEGASGPVNVYISTAGGTAHTVFSYSQPYPAPVMNTPSPNSNVTNGTTVAISGAYFTRPSYYVTDDSGYTDCYIESDTMIRCPMGGMPEGASGTVTVTVGTAGGTTSTSFTYYQPYTAPVIQRIDNYISTAYGTTQGVIYAQVDRNAYCKWNLGGDFDFGTQGNDFHWFDTDGSISGYINYAGVTVTGLQPGYNVIYIRCANAYDWSKVSGAAATETWIDSVGPPTVTANVSPDSWHNQGESSSPILTISGTNFKDDMTSIVSAVDIGGKPCSNVSVTSATRLTCQLTSVYDSLQLQRFAVSVTTNRGTGSRANAFKFTAIPVAGAVSPTTVSTTVRTTVTITGRYFFETGSASIITSVNVIRADTGESMGACAGYLAADTNTSITCTTPTAPVISQSCDSNECTEVRYTGPAYIQVTTRYGTSLTTPFVTYQ